MNGITFAGKHSFKDFGIWIKSKSIGDPSKQKNKITIPYMNGSYDFSNIYGDVSYDDRTLEYTFEIIEDSKELCNAKKIQVLNWLNSENEESILLDDTILGYYFLAECTDTKVEEDGRIFKIVATFTAYPFKIQKWNAGEDIWDEFNFELDYSFDTSFEIQNSLYISLYNNSIHKLKPTIICSSPMQVIDLNTSIVYEFLQGESSSYNFLLDVGENKYLIKGKGSITFKYKNEVI